MVNFMFGIFCHTKKKKRLREDLKSELYTGCYKSKLKTKTKHTQLGKTHSLLGHFKHIGLLIGNNRAHYPLSTELDSKNSKICQI